MNRIPLCTARFLRRSHGLLVLSTLGVLSLVSSTRAVAAPAVQYYFSSSSTAYTPVTSETFSAGQTFTLSVFYSTSGFAASGNTFNSMDVFVGYDQSNSYGTAATPLDGRLSLADGGTANGGAVSTVAASGFSEVIPGVSNQLEGGQPTGQDGTLVRPYGVDIDLALTPGATSLQDVGTPTHLLDIMFTNTDLAAGPETISIYNGGSGNDGTTYVDGTTTVRPNSTLFTAMQLAGSGSATPEPGTLALIPAGLLPLGAVIRGRRRRKA